MLFYYKGNVTVEEYENFCGKNKTSADKSVFLFPGNQSHHGAKHNLYSVKSGGGLARVAGELGQKGLPVLRAYPESRWLRPFPNE